MYQLSRRFVFSFTVALICFGATDAFAQHVLGDVAPKLPTVGAYGKTLDSLLQTDQDDRLWNAMTPEERTALLAKIQDITIQVPIGPVPPKPPVKPQPPKRVPPRTPPAKGDYEKALADLQQALKESAKNEPDRELPAALGVELKQVIERLAAAKQQ